jgi:hypothetical protein
MPALLPAPAQRQTQRMGYPTAAAWTRALARTLRRRVLPLHRHRHRAPRTASPTAVALMASARSDSCNDGTEGLSRLFRRRPASSDAYPAGSTDALGTPTTPASCRGCYWWRTNVCCLEKRKSGHGRFCPIGRTRQPGRGEGERWTPSRHSGASPELARFCTADSWPGDAGNREDWPASPVWALSTQCESLRDKSCRLARWRLSRPPADGRPGFVMTRRLTARCRSPSNRREIAEGMTGINTSRSLETRL